MKARLCSVPGCKRHAYRIGNQQFARCDAHLTLLIEAIFGRRGTRVGGGV